MLDEKYTVEITVSRKIVGLMFQAEASIRRSTDLERENLAIAYADTPGRAVADALRQVASYLTTIPID